MLMIALGLATSSYQPSMLVLVSRPSKKLMMGVKMGFYSASIAAGFGLGVISGGFMGDIFGLNWIFFPCGIMLTLGLFAMLQVFRNVSEETEETEVFRRLGIRTLKKSLSLNIPKMFKGSFDSPLIKTGMLALCIAIFLRNSGFRGLTTFLPLYLKDLGASNSLLGMIISINFISQIILMPPAGWLSDIFGRKITISIGMFTSFIAMLLFSVINDPYSAIPIQILVGFSWSLILTSTNAYVADVIPMNKRGRGMGLIRSSQTLGGAVGPTLAGLSINFYGYRIMLQSLMVLPILGSILSFTKLKK